MPTTNHKRQNPASRGSSSEPVMTTEQPAAPSEAPETPRPASQVAAAPQPQAAAPQPQAVAPQQQPAPPAPQAAPAHQPPPHQNQQGQQARRGEGLNIGELKEMSIQKLTGIAKELNVAGA